MDFNVSKGYSSNRISITTKMGAEAKNVKVYKKGTMIANLACKTGVAKKITDSEGHDYVVNLRSLGKAWASSGKIVKSPLSNKVKDEFAKHFFSQIEKDKITSQFIEELEGILQKDEVGLVEHELRRLRELPTKKTQLNTIEEKNLLYTRIRGGLLSFPNKNEDKDWSSKVNQCFPKSAGMSIEKFEELVKTLNKIKIPGNSDTPDSI